MACPFCGNLTDSHHLYCDQCGASLKSETLPLDNEEESTDFFPGALVYEGCLSLSGALVFRSPMGEPLWKGTIGLEPSPLRLSLFFQTEESGPLAGDPQKWKISYHRSAEFGPVFHGYGNESEFIGRIVADSSDSRQRVLRAQNRIGAECSIWSSIGLMQRSKNGLIQAGLYLSRVSSLWQGWESHFGFSGSGFGEDDPIPCGITGDVTIPEYYVYRFQDLSDRFDFRLVLALLGLQAYGLWDPKQIPEYVTSLGMNSAESAYDLR